MKHITDEEIEEEMAYAFGFRKDTTEAAIFGAKWARDRDGWIPVSEKLPEIGQEVLIGIDTRVIQAYLNANGWHGSFEVCDQMEEVDRVSPKLLNQEYITHWMPLPLLPKHPEK